MNDMLKNKKTLAFIGIGIALLILVAAVAVAMGGGFSTTNDGNSSIVIETPSISTITSTPTPIPTVTTSDTVYDAVHVQMLLDTSWESVVDDPKHPEYVETMTTTILFQTRTYDEVLWNYEDFQIFYPDLNPGGLLCYGFTDDAPKNSFYSGPIVLWRQEEPGGEIIYTVGSGCWITDGVMSWVKEPYRYGIVTYEEPPKEVIEIFEEAGRTLIY